MSLDTVASPQAWLHGGQLLVPALEPHCRRLLDKFPCAEVHDDRLLQKCEKLEMIRRESRGNGLYIHAQIVGHDVSDCFYTKSFYDQCYRLINFFHVFRINK